MENRVCLFSVYMSMRTFASTVVPTFSNLSRYLKIQSQDVNYHFQSVTCGPNPPDTSTAGVAVSLCVGWSM